MKQRHQAHGQQPLTNRDRPRSSPLWVAPMVDEGLFNARDTQKPMREGRNEKGGLGRLFRCLARAPYSSSPFTVMPGSTMMGPLRDW